MTMLRRISPLLKLVLLAGLVLIVLDIAAFRSGFHARWSDPDSLAGSVAQTIDVVNGSREPNRRNILVLGNSQVGEGFSGPFADAASPNADLHFINGSAPGTTPRVWNYLLRELDPTATRFAAIVLMASYDNSSDHESLANYRADIRHLSTVIDVRDFFDFPASFPVGAARSEAQRAILFPWHAMRDDVKVLLQNPWRRYRIAIRNFAKRVAGEINYPGRDGAMPPLVIEPSSRVPKDWGSTDQSLRMRLEAHLKGIGIAAAPELQAENTIYWRRWLGDIAERYRAADVPVIVFSMPRGPFHQQMVGAPEPRGAVAALSAAGKIIALPGNTFVELEQPRYFFDTLHLNRVGRERFSQSLAAHIAPLVH